eukprot:4678717-Prorocentrum_lima.AAC.1
MTSSLVGSEMCIRDSFCVIGLVWLSAYHGTKDLQFLMPIQRSHMLWTGPVSYTHLTLPTICSV